jgi:lysophospholipase L1-like esterase
MNYSSNQIGLTQATVYDISAADLAGANSGQRPDLLAKTQAIFRTPDGKTYAANAARSQLVAAAVPVTAETNGTSGKITAIGASGDLVPTRALKSKITQLVQHYYQRIEQTAFGGYSWQTNFTLPAKASAIRIAVASSSATAGGATIDAAAIAASATLGTASPTGAFQALTFGRSSTVTQPNAVVVGSVPLVWSDWVSINSVNRTDIVGAPPAYSVRIFSASTNTVCTGPNEAEGAFGAIPMDWKTQFKVGNFVSTNQAGFTTPGGPNCAPLFAVEYIAESGGLTTVAEFSDSISVGLGITGAGTQGMGPLAYACASLNFGFSPYQSGLSGRTSTNSLYAYLDAADRIPAGSCVIFRPYSRNGYGANNMGVAHAFLREAYKRSHIPVLQTGIYESATPSNNTNMQAVNAATKAIAAAEGVALMDLEPLINAGNSATYLLGDGIHPNAVGRALLAQEYANVLAKLI